MFGCGMKEAPTKQLSVHNTHTHTHTHTHTPVRTESFVISNEETACRSSIVRGALAAGASTVRSEMTEPTNSFNVAETGGFGGDESATAEVKEVAVERRTSASSACPNCKTALLEPERVIAGHVRVAGGGGGDVAYGPVIMKVPPDTSIESNVIDLLIVTERR